MPNDTARGFDAALIEAMRYAERKAWAAAGWGTPAKNPPWLGQAQNVLVLLCAARPDVAAVLKGEAVAVPREATETMMAAWDSAAWRKLQDGYGDAPTEHPEDGGGSFGYGYRAMLAASPYYSNDR